ncbi:MAG: hypothetical protein ISR59_12485 [Anaerolineales bacterium]|uniref:Zinc-finger domain-containing protein n=1 Tax=Candidatus Desulfolinea nitratireducens TaxID=2841698 RepID=A0A8J6NLF1_9CHLR|nr:hypothetical protein [Candidatus Desulfolinea nitratireducens]MBL6961915.1 hypothetical protein [Anaerolineales bacterium]
MNSINPIKKSSSMTVNLLKKLIMTNEYELPCDEVHFLVDQYAEMKLRGDDVEGLMPMVKHHLDMCRDCLEEYEALVAALEFEENL